MTKDKDLDLGKTKTVSAEELGFVPVVPIDSGEKTSVFSQLLSGTEDDERAVEPTDDDLGTLEQEWQILIARRREEGAGAAENLRMLLSRVQAKATGQQLTGDEES